MKKLAIVPAWAAQMSMNDFLVQTGMKLDQAIDITKPCLPFLKKVIELKKISA